MSKWKESYTAGRKYRTEWENIYPWIEKSKSDKDKAFCKLCKKELQPRKATIEKHSKSEDHKFKSKLVGSNTTIKLTSKSSEIANISKKAELQLAVATCCHNSISSIDHFGEIIKKIGKGSALENTRLHRTKCSVLIKSVISPSLKENLMTKIKGKYFC